MTVTRLLRIAFRALAALFMLVVVVAAAVWGWSTWRDSRLERQVSVAKSWEVKGLLHHDQLKVMFKTRCRERRLNYQLTLESKDGKSDSLEALRQQAEEITLSFYDADGFELWELRVPVAEMSRVFDDNRWVQLARTGTGGCTPDLYVRTSKVRAGLAKQDAP